MNKKLHHIIVYSFALLMNAHSISFAQSSNVQVFQTNNNFPKFSTHSDRNSFFISFKDFDVKPSEWMHYVRQWFGVNSDHDIILCFSETDTLGIIRSVYQHKFLNYTVENEWVIVHHKNNKIISVNGQFTSDITVENLPQIDTNILYEIVFNNYRSKSKINISNEKLVIGSYLKNESIVFEPLYVADVSALPDILPQKVYVNSENNIVKKIDKVFDTDVPSLSKTYYKGLQEITVKQEINGFVLQDSNRKIHTYDGSMVEGYDFDSKRLIPYSEYTNTDANYTSDETTSAVEVHWGMKMTYDYYKNVHNRLSYDGKDSEILNFNNISNVFWGHGMNAGAIDYNDLVCMIYGNGRNADGEPILNPVVGVDVAGHEFSHLVINRNGLGGLVYQGESGAINESIADVFGASVEFYTKINPNWFIGEGIVNNKPGFLRDMKNPNVRNMPDTYYGNFWFPTDSEDDKGGVHFNSSVGNYWFYLMSEGGSGTNDFDYNYQVSPMGLDKAGKIVYRALMNYLTPDSNYYDYYFATRQAVLDLYGNTESSEWKTLNDAWAAVGIGLSNAYDYTFTSNDWVNIFPNPATQYFIIEITKDIAASVQLFDNTGKLVLAKSLHFGENIIDTSSIAKGVYVLKTSYNGENFNKKLIIK